MTTQQPDVNEAAERLDNPVAYASVRGPIDNLQFVVVALTEDEAAKADGWLDARVIPLYDRAPTGEGDIASQARAWRRTSEALKEIGMLSHVESFMAATGGDRVLSFIKHLGQQSAELAELREKLAKSIDAERLADWLKDSHRKPPHLEFTAGPERELADLIERAIVAATGAA